MNRLEVVAEVVDCERCSLHGQCTAPVAMSGPAPAPVAIIGEAPGEQEDKQGRPFVGPAGQLLREALAATTLDIDDVAILNTVSCWPRGTPTPEAVRACHPIRSMQLEAIDPQWVLLLGKVAMKAVNPDLGLRHGRAKPFTVDGRHYFVGYHPSFVLRDTRFKRTFFDEVQTFAQMVTSGGWPSSLLDTCSACPIEAMWWDPTGLGWCEVHLPRDERRKLEAIRARARTDYDQAVERREAALAAVEDAADPGWLERAYDALVGYLRSHGELFVDDFWSETGLDRPREARALGAVIQRAAREGLMEKSGEFRKSVASNLASKPVWTSRIYTT